MDNVAAETVSRVFTCPQVEVEHQASTGILQPLPIPVWKWEKVTIDFVVGLPKIQKGNNADFGRNT